MSRISLVEQYNNKDVIAQIYDVKDTVNGALESIDSAVAAADQAATAAQTAAAAANNAVSLVNQLDARTDVLEDYVGAPGDAASTTGTVYARIAKNAQDIDNVEDAHADLVTVVAGNSATIAGMEPIVSSLPINYQERSQKDQLNGYAGLTSAGKIATSQIDTGVNLNQILQAGAQLNTGEFLYIGPGGVIRSRVIGEGVEYVGNYASLAALQAYPNPQNGDFATIYGSAVDDGFYVYDGTSWNKSALFDATDYELIANKVTGISSASSNTEYPSAKAVYDFCEASDVVDMTSAQTTASGGVTLTVAAQNVNGSQLATTSVLLPTTNTATSGVYTPITSDGVAAEVSTLNTAIVTAAATKQNTLTSVTITLTAANWSSNTQTITGIGNVTATNIVWVSPDSSSFDEYGSCGIRVTAQGAGSLTFVSNGTDPTNNLNVIVVG